MKIRLDYVTNSSSSSFIALNKEEYSTNKLKEQFESIVIGKEGNREFSRFLSESRDFFSKLNFLSLSLLYLDDIKDKEDSWYRNFLLNKNPDFFSVNYKEILNQLIKKELNKKLDWKLIKKMKEDCDSYIDHQSLFEGIPDILKDEDSMKRFLFNDKSIVVFDGDESGCCFQLLDKYFKLNKHYDYIDRNEEENLLGFYLYISESIEKANRKTKDNFDYERNYSKKDIELIEKELKGLIRDRDISEEIIDRYLGKLEIYRIDDYPDWYEEYIFDNYEAIESVIDKISEMELEDYKEEVKINQTRIKKEIEEKLSYNSTIWLITNCFAIDEDNEKDKELIKEIDNRFDKGTLFKENERLKYFRAL